ncbi:helix-turn-helix domain-containing protein [Microbacterium album]|uniref:Helix-turn-helix domain-containing protein n=1 Tax=Microbacterium album TaxID=2053191 RepID=A0A917MMK6_9MICO|nr:helix-turn-helix domain-containing protein [Microbacterium album]GGH44977.1 hypothetical protein GCM10010921_20050 [Microbacterium album]
MTDTDGWIRLPNTVIEHSALNAHELLVYIVLLKHRNPTTGKCWPGLSTIADESRLSRRSVIRAISGLEEHSAIKVTRQRNVGEKNRPNVYEVAVLSESQGDWWHVSAKGRRKPQRNLSPESRARLANAARTARSDSESLRRAVDSSGSASEALGSDSESPGVVTPRHPNKPNENKTNEETFRSALPSAHDSVTTFEPATSTDKQRAYLHDLHIHLTGQIPNARSKDTWKTLTKLEAQDLIDRYLRQIPRYDRYEGPEYGTPAYNALTPVGREWADRGFIPDMLEVA